MWFLKELWFHRRQHYLTVIATSVAFFLVLSVSLFSETITVSINNQLNSLGLDVSMLQIMDSDSVPENWFDHWCRDNKVDCGSVFCSWDLDDFSLVSCSSELGNLFHWPYRAGRFFGESESMVNDNCAVLGHEVWLHFSQPQVGDTVCINGISFTVCGIIDSLDGNLFIDADNCIFVPQGYGMEGVIPQVCYYFIGDDTGLEEYLAPDSYVYVNQGQLSMAGEVILKTVNGVLMFLAMVSAAVAFMGLMNSMLSALPQRMGEIGIKKAFGASEGLIYMQFLMETVAVMLVSGMVSIAAAAIISLLLIRTTGFSVSMLSGISTVMRLILAGTACGLYPAWKASRITVMEAIRRKE